MFSRLKRIIFSYFRSHRASRCNHARLGLCGFLSFKFSRCHGLRQEKPEIFDIGGVCSRCVCMYLQRVLLSVVWVQRLTVIGEVDHGE